jgi:hypothetical protein
MANTIIGLLQTIICLLVIVPFTVSVMRTGGGPFGFGALLLPAVLPLSFAGLFGIYGILDYESNFSRTKRLLVLTHVITAVAGVASFLFIPVFPFAFAAIPIAVMLLAGMSKENVGQKILITNALILSCFLFFLYLLFTSDIGSPGEVIKNLWM